MKIGVYSIALDEHDNLDPWYEAIDGQADHILLADTGSTDGTQQHAEELGITVHQLSIRPFRFDDAWNCSLALLPSDLDVAMLCSLDIRPPKDWREQLEHEWSGGDGTALYSWFEVNGLRWRYPFIHSRHGYRYRFPIHELLVPDRVTEQRIDSELVFTHSGTTRQSAPDHRQRNIAMLRAARSENPEDLRQLHYLGRELMYAQQWTEAIGLLTEHANSTAFPEERSESWRYIGDCLVASRPIEDVLPLAYQQAADTAPQRREGWVALADLARKQERWDDCLTAAERSLAITEKSWYFSWPFAWGPMPYDLAALASWFLGRHEDAVRYGEQACALAPDDRRLSDNLAWYQRSPALAS